MSELHTGYSLENMRYQHPQDAADFAVLLEVLTDEPQDTDKVRADVERAVASPSTEVVTVRDNTDDSVASTVTVNMLPVLTGRGTVAWIDDVVTNPAHQGRGLSRTTMAAAESIAAQSADEVLLTSQPSREGARRGYERQGYVLSADGIYRKLLADVHGTDADGVDHLQTYTANDVEQIAALLGEDPKTVEENLQHALEANHTAVLTRRHMGAVAAVAVVNLCPIPTGSKPWVDNLAGTPSDQHALLDAGERWLARQGAPYVNVVDDGATELSDGYVRRNTGLFVKQLAKTD